jgi:hypothetical protein
MPIIQRPLTHEQILAWADAYHARTGRWPSAGSGAIADAPGETWQAVNLDLARGFRGLPGGSSLARLLAAERGKRNQRNLPPLIVKQILEWADKHHERTGRWPNFSSGAVGDAPGEVWVNINAALKGGLRGLPGGDTLSRLLGRHRRGGGSPHSPWTREEDDLLRAVPPKDAARRTGRSPAAVYIRRHTLGIRSPQRHG